MLPGFLEAALEPRQVSPGVVDLCGNRVTRVSFMDVDLGPLEKGSGSGVFSQLQLQRGEPKGQLRSMRGTPARQTVAELACGFEGPSGAPELAQGRGEASRIEAGQEGPLASAVRTCVSLPYRGKILLKGMLVRVRNR